MTLRLPLCFVLSVPYVHVHFCLMLQDKWSEVRIGKSAMLRGIKPCSRYIGKAPYTIQ